MATAADSIIAIFKDNADFRGDGAIKCEVLRKVMQRLVPDFFTDLVVDELLKDFQEATGSSAANGSVDISQFGQWVMAADGAEEASHGHKKLLQVLSSVVSICCYRCIQGKEAEWKKVIDEITSDVEKGSVPGLVHFYHTMAGPQTFVCVGLFESTKALDNYKDSACKTYLEKMQPLLAGSAVFDDVGMAVAARSFAAPKSQQICCMCSYQCAEGKEKDWEAVVADITASVKSGGIQGMTMFMSVMPDPRTFSCVGLFESQAAVDNYAAMMSEQFMAKMKPLLGGEAIYDIVAPLKGCVVSQDPLLGT
eukprot:TRINITY_DN77293_c0_g1_i1.p1 TRINITY_DN77293_c0_g1~~TRINITY_DN77293_c0_g1_i1.p1  ORF type:complete len:322 (+),score=65.01 TRINITY_DN77293_c0_g1_i1:43-966(+)